MYARVVREVKSLQMNDDYVLWERTFFCFDVRKQIFFLQEKNFSSIGDHVSVPKKQFLNKYLFDMCNGYF